MRGFIIFLFFTGCVLIYAIIMSIIEFKRKKNLLKSLSKKFNLNIISKSEIEGIVENQIVKGYFRKEKTSDNNENTFFYLNVSPKNKLSYSIRVKRTYVDVFFKKNINISNFRTGDNQFDDLVSLSVDNEKAAFSKLNFKVRKLIKKYINEFYNLKFLKNYLLFKNSNFDSILLSKVLEAMIYISKRFSSFKYTDELLMENILNNDEINKIKIKNMEYLLESPDLDKYNRILTSLTDNPIKEIQVMAAYGLKEDGIPILLKILRESDNNLKHFSLKYLSDFLNYESVKNYIYTFLDSENLDLIVDTINVLTEKEDKNSIQVIINFIKNKSRIIDSSKAVKLSLIKYSSKLEVKKNFKWLVSLLKDHKNDVVIPVINGLVILNDIKAVESLLPLTKNVFNAEIKKSALDAINILQKNIPDTNRGTLTMIEESMEGQLSIEENNNSGDLSLDK